MSLGGMIEFVQVQLGGCGVSVWAVLHLLGNPGPVVGTLSSAGEDGAGIAAAMGLRWKQWMTAGMFADVWVGVAAVVGFGVAG